MRRRPLPLVVVALIGLALLPACDPPPPRTTFAVTTAVDGLDAAPGDGVCEVTAGAGDCSLRAALAEARAVGFAEITAPDPAADPLGTAQIRTALTQAIGQDIELTVAAALRTQAKPLVNRTLLDSMAQP